MLSATPVAAAHGGGGGGDRLLLHHHHHHRRRGGAHPPPPPPAPPTPMVAAGAAAAAALPCSLEDPSRKVRKPYTITKSRECWSEVEHDKFLEAIHLFDRDWKKIEAFVGGSKTTTQIRSHAQKYFLKLQKNGTSEHVPPPRPKRKAAHPYPQKAPKNAAIITQVVTPLPASSLVLEPCYAVSGDSSTVVRNSTSNATLSSCVNGSVQPFGAAQMTKVPSEAIMANNCCSRTESPTEVWLASETTEKENQVPFLRVMPDFSQVYSFLAGVFDPNTSGHLEKLKEMDPIDVETVLLLMRNLSANLTSPDFEAHKRLLSTYGSGTEEANSNSFGNLLQASRTPVTPFMVEVE